MILLCILSIGMRAGDYQYLVFTLSNGTTQAVTTTDLTIAFTSDNLVATSGGTTVATLPLSTLTSMEFSVSLESIRRIRRLSSRPLFPLPDTVVT